MIERNLSERYRLEGRIGQGGMAVVYSGVDTVLRRRVAIKVLRPQLAADADFVSRFYAEAQHAAKLSHPNIVNIYDVGREGDDYYIVMELIDGATLAEMIEHDGRLPEPVAIDFGAQIASGLAYAHRQGLLHRDVKPANVLVTKDDVVKISDFGIARAVTTQTITITQPGMVMGSVFYISPEQAQGHDMHETSDLYSLGVVLFQMLTGKLPYTGESPVTVALKHVSSPVPSVDAEDDLSVSPALAAIVRKLLQKDPAARFPSAAAVAKALREAREHPLITTPYDVVGSNGDRLAQTGPKTIPNPKPRPSPQPDRRTLVVDMATDDDGIERVEPPSNLWIVVLVACFALACAVGLGYFLTNRPGGILGGPTSVALPSVVGSTSADAEKKLDAAGLHYNVVPITSETVAADRVIREEPHAAGKIDARTVVQLYVSSGLPTVDLIDVRQYSSDDAQRYLKNAKLVPQIVEKYDKSARGTVLSQKPTPGTAVPIRSKVVLVVSKGAQPVGVPDIVSQTLSDATSELAARHLTISVTERDPNDEIPADTITSQSPQPGTQVDPNSMVQVIVSSGTPSLAAPDVEGRLALDAASVLSSAGLQANVEYVVDDSVPLGTVMKQNPERGTSVKKNSTVELDVAVPGVVPDVSGRGAQDAQNELQNAGYKIGNSSYVQEGPEGSVARTEPVAGSSLRPGETVMLYINGVSKEGQ